MFSPVMVTFVPPLVRTLAGGSWVAFGAFASASAAGTSQPASQVTRTVAVTASRRQAGAAARQGVQQQHPLT